MDAALMEALRGAVQDDRDADTEPPSERAFLQGDADDETEPPSEMMARSEITVLVPPTTFRASPSEPTIVDKAETVASNDVKIIPVMTSPTDWVPCMAKG